MLFVDIRHLRTAGPIWLNNLNAYNNPNKVFEKRKIGKFGVKIL